MKDVVGENLDGIKTLLLVEPYNYTFKADKANKLQVGVIAQDLQKYSPNSVTQGEDGFLSIRWDEMFFAIVNAAKELNNLVVKADKDAEAIVVAIDNIDSEQSKIQKRINRLNARLQKLENN